MFNDLSHAALAAQIEQPWTKDHVPLAAYAPTPAITAIIDQIVSLHRLRQGMIKAQTKLRLQALASIRFATRQDGDYDSDDAKAKARKRTDALYAAVAADANHPLAGAIRPYTQAAEPLEAQRAAYEREMVRLVKQLPAYSWAKGVKGFGDVSFATIVGECGDIGEYRSISGVWKRMGVAVIDGKRQGAPGATATADDWIAHGYNKQRRSVGWNARNQVIGGMGMWRPAYGEDVEANPDLTYYQRLYAARARYESEKLGLPITESAKGKESYKAHVANRAHRYVEKRLLRNLYIEWRRA